MRQFLAITVWCSLCFNPLGGFGWAADTRTITVEVQSTPVAPQKVAKTEAVATPQDSAKYQAKKATWVRPVIVIGVVTVVAAVGGFVTWLFAGKTQSSSGKLSSGNPIIPIANHEPEKDSGNLQMALMQQDSRNFQWFVDQASKTAFSVHLNKIEKPEGNLMEKLSRLSNSLGALEKLEALGESLERLDLNNIPAELAGLESAYIKMVKEKLQDLAALKMASVAVFCADNAQSNALVNWGEIFKAAEAQRRLDEQKSQLEALLLQEAENEEEAKIQQDTEKKQADAKLKNLQEQLLLAQ
jgi:hypothetical protein